MHRFHPIRMILNNIRWGLMDAKFRGENLLREGSVPYTVIRPGEPGLLTLTNAVVHACFVMLCSQVCDPSAA